MGETVGTEWRVFLPMKNSRPPRRCGRHGLRTLEERLKQLTADGDTPTDAPSAAREPQHAVLDIERAADASSWWGRVLAWLRGT